MEDNVFDATEDRTTPQTIDQIHLREFITLYESLPEIWDASNEYFTNKTKKMQAYQKLQLVYKKIKPYATIHDVKKKINSLRSNYRKELRKALDSQQSGVSKDQVYKPKSWVFHMLTFLSKADLGCQNHLCEDLRNGEEEENSQPSSSVFFSSLNIAPPPTKKDRKDSTKTEHNDIPEEAYSFSSQTDRREQNLNLTALYWTQKLEQLHPVQRIFAEKAINDILFEAALGTLKRNSVQINASSPVAQITSPGGNSSRSSEALNSTITYPNDTNTSASKLFNTDPLSVNSPPSSTYCDP